MTDTLIDILSQLKQGNSRLVGRGEISRNLSQVPVADHSRDSLGRVKTPSARRYKNHTTDSMAYPQADTPESDAVYPPPKERGFTANFDKLDPD